MLLVDPILIEQVLVNLLKNAAESIEHGQAARRRGAASNCACCPRQVDEQHVVEFSVLDSGTGLAPEVMDRLYEAFFSTKAEGMGIGLNLCRTIVESHQGRMQAENIYNGAEVAGCRFSFWIPVLRMLSNSVANKDAGVTCMSLIPKKGTVYVVDDDEAVRDSLQWLLEGKDYRVRCFDSAESFLSPLRPARGRLPDRRHPHGRHDRPRTAGPPDRAQVAAAHRLHHRPRRRADGGRTP